MAHIQVLDNHVAELIAAGEVVERPASVVKELVENAIDAQSTAISVSIRRGGMAEITVSDNGIGIAPDELPSAFLRHATSKIRSADDLGAIGTLGFRGEALAAICAVSRVEVRTRERGAETGARLQLEGGVCGGVEECGTPEGTIIAARDLFYNTPARLKFMRKDSAETAAINGLMQRLALSRPDISFRFDKDGVNALHTPGDGKLLSAIYAAYGRDFARSLLPAEGRGGDVAVSGYVTFPAFGRGSRAMQMFFLNGRCIKSQLLTAALEEAYKNQNLKGKFPGCVLSITMPAHMADVNAHPAKTEVKFSNERDLFRTVYHTILDDLTAKGAPTNVGLSDGASAAPNPGFFQSMDAKTYREQSAPRKPESVWSGYGAESARRPEGLERSGQTINRFRDEDDATQTQAVPADIAPTPAGVAGIAPAYAESPDITLEPAGVAPAQPSGAPELSEQVDLLPEPPVKPWRIAGELFDTYIVCEAADGNAYLIDKHAAHERVRFDALKAGAVPPMRQTLLQPVAAELSREDAALLLDNLPELERLGFSCEDFGGNALLAREIPSDLNPGDVTATLEELAENLRTGRNPEEKREAMFRTMACKSAIRGGEESSPRELRALVEKAQSGEVRYCPHGRPVAVKFTKLEIEKLFKRV
ncbi:MAG: DNA mismatch repair endonuclease MutL [Oscillibacter sp.]|nr:DNA mismatch repair endonuclease MutL [Oscillibacter sp.]